MKDKMLSKYIAKSRVGSVFTDSELQVIKKGDVDQIVDTFFDLNNDYYKTQMQCAIKSLSSFINMDVELSDVKYEKEFKGEFVGCQIMDGDIDVFLGVAGNNSDLLGVASAFSQEDMQEFDEDAYDALCELINIMNGAYATRLSDKEIEVTLHPPVFYVNTEVKADNGFYVATFDMGNHNFKILMAADDKIKLIA